MNRTVRWVAAAVCAIGLVQAAEAGFSLGGKLWYVQFEDKSVDSTFMAGPKAEYSSGDFWVSGMFLVGKTKVSGQVPAQYYDPYYGYYTVNQDVSFDVNFQDAEVVGGMSFSVVDVGVGMRHSTWTFKGAGGEENVRIYGPMAYAGAGAPFGKSPIGWYAGASFMFLDLGNMKDVAGDSGEHYNVEGGLSFAANRLQFTLGYRIKKFTKYDSKDNDLTQSGPAASGVFTF